MKKESKNERKKSKKVGRIKKNEVYDGKETNKEMKRLVFFFNRRKRKETTYNNNI